MTAPSLAPVPGAPFLFVLAVVLVLDVFRSTAVGGGLNWGPAEGVGASLWSMIAGPKGNLYLIAGLAHIVAPGDRAQ